MIETDNIYNMDCLEGMRLMANGSVDAVIADLPYASNTTGSVVIFIRIFLAFFTGRN